MQSSHARLLKTRWGPVTDVALIALLTVGFSLSAAAVAGASGTPDSGAAAPVRIAVADRGRALTVVTPPGRQRSLADFQLTNAANGLRIASLRAASPRRALLVLDTSVSATSLTAMVGAAREFLLAIPQPTRVAVVAAATTITAAPLNFVSRSSALSQLVSLRRDAKPPVYAGWLDSLAKSTPGGHLTALYFGQSGAPAAADPATVTALADAGTTVSVAVIGRAPAGYLGNAPARTAGRLTQITDLGTFVQAADNAAADVDNTYRLVLSASLPIRPVSIQVKGVENAVTGEPDAVAIGTTRGNQPVAAARHHTAVYATAWPYLAGFLILVVGGSALVTYRRRVDQSGAPRYSSGAVST